MPDLHRTSGGQALDGEGLFGSLLGGCTQGRSGGAERLKARPRAEPLRADCAISILKDMLRNAVRERHRQACPPNVGGGQERRRARYQFWSSLCLAGVNSAILRASCQSSTTCPSTSLFAWRFACSSSSHIALTRLWMCPSSADPQLLVEYL